MKKITRPLVVLPMVCCIAVFSGLTSASLFAPTIITNEVVANVKNTVSLVGYEDAQHVSVVQTAKHGTANVDLKTRLVTYTPNSYYYGSDTAVVKLGKQNCLLWTCWTSWSNEVTFVFNVGPGKQLGMKNATKVSKVGVAYHDENAIENPDMNDEYHQAILREFNAITLENGHKWNFLVKKNESGAYEYNYAKADKITRFANQNGIEVKGHAVTWYAALPKFVLESNDKATVQGYVDRHAENVLTHYACNVTDKSLCIKHWDVVNELSASSSLIEDASPTDGRYRNEHLYKTLGSGYIANLLTKARAVRPDAVLWVNDYNVEKATHKSDNLYSIVKGLVDNNVPLDGVGFQSHVVFDHSPIDLINNMQRYHQLGLQVNISELDVPAPTLLGFSAEILTKVLGGKKIQFFDLLAAPAIGRTEQDQQIYYQNYAAICELMPNCNWVTQWGLSDDKSWMKSSAKALTFNQDLSRKGTYFAMLKGLSGNGQLQQPANSGVIGNIIEAGAGWGL